MFQTLKNAFKVKEVRNKILWTLLLVLLYRLGSFIPVPGIDVAAFKSMVTTPDGTGFLDILSAIGGGALGNGTLFAIGISPYINASIIMQLLTIAIPPLERLSKQGDEGRAKITKLTRYLTMILAALQAVGILLVFGNESALNLYPLGTQLPWQPWMVYMFTTVVFIAGAALTMWIGERITEYGVSNGISMLIFAGIIATASHAILAAFKNIFSEGWGYLNSGWSFVGFLALAVVLFAFIITVDRAERRIPVQYSKQIKGNKMYGGQSSMIPIKVNGSGVLPLIFAFAITSFPELIMTTFGWAETNFGNFYSTYLGTRSEYGVYSVALTIWIFIFAFFYQQVQFNPVDVANNIQNNGGFIPGIRPGKPTADYLSKVSQRITFFGATFLAIIAFVPTFLFGFVLKDSANGQLLNAFSATGMLIVVSVALEFEKQLENQLLMKYYKGFLKG